MDARQTTQISSCRQIQDLAIERSGRALFSTRHQKLVLRDRSEGELLKYSAPHHQRVERKAPVCMHVSPPGACRRRRNGRLLISATPSAFTKANGDRAGCTIFLLIAALWPHGIHPYIIPLRPPAPRLSKYITRRRARVWRGPSSRPTGH